MINLPTYILHQISEFYINCEFLKNLKIYPTLIIIKR